MVESQRTSFGHKKTTMKERLKVIALRREIQLLFAFGVIAGVGYYMYLKNKKDKATSNF